MNDKVLAALRLLVAVNEFRRHLDLGPLRESIDALTAQITPTLPAKPDGTPWTDEDVTAAAAAASLPWQRVIDRNSDAQDDGA